ncbi:hypothetical protein LSCM4_06164 [Leishmania orientalis]|uniref:RNA editing complex protein MP90 n=1 Tax=Leishmania orientalis TaxID=2249476 RepID=A0A836KW94_9TRYP|nr:hypothetical protein LSCM4_06164 [Leishmania orientalis]
MPTSSLHLMPPQAVYSPATHRLAAAATPATTLISSAHSSNRLAMASATPSHPIARSSPVATVLARHVKLVRGSGDEGAGSGMLFHPTRALRALTPVEVAHSNTFGSFRQSNRAAAGAWWRSSTETVSRVRGEKLDRVRDPFQGVFLPLQGVTEVEMTRRSPTPPPDFPLDRLPNYEPHDGNGPPRTKIGFHLPMRTLPASLAVGFFFPGAESNDGSQAVNASSGSSSRAHRSRGAACSDFGADYDDGSIDAGVHQESVSKLDRAGYDKGGRSAAGAGNVSGDAPSAFCRLCRESFDNDGTLRAHITVANRARHVSHPVREVALETLTLLAMRGYPIDNVMTVWADILYNCPLFPRIRGLTDPRWSIEKRADQIGTILRALKQVGVLDVSLAAAELTEQTGAPDTHYRRRRVAFDRLEYIGDNCWGTNISNRILLLYPDQQWLYSERCSTFTLVRDACEMNINLDFVFDTLELWHLLSTTAHSQLGHGKMKADLVEGIFGELHLYLYGMVPKLQDDVEYVETNGAREVQLVALVEHCLTELYDLIVLKHARDLVTSAIPLAKELAAKRIWAQTRPYVLPQKRPHTCWARSRSATGSAASPSLAVTFAAPAAARAATTGQILSFQLSRSVAAPANASVSALDDLFDVSPSRLQQQQQQKPAFGAAKVGGSATESCADGHTDAVAVGANSTDSGQQTEEEAAVTSGRAGVKPIFPNSAITSLTLSAHIGLGNTRILPALPRLFTVPRVCPERVPNPLRLLPLSAIPSMTYCHHTRSDVFATMKKSYERLGLLHEEPSRMHYVVSPAPPEWSVLISTLVPQLLRFVPTGSTKAASPSSDVEDGYAAAARRLLASIDDGGLYCRDGFYDLAASSSPRANTSRPHATRSQMRTAWTLQNAGLPPLSTTPSEREEDGRVSSDKKGCYTCTFAPSRYVPPGTRTPPAGVVTDRNLCRGVFAFLAVGVNDPVIEAEELTRMVAASHRAATPSGSATGAQPSGKDAVQHTTVGSAPRASPTTYEERIKAAWSYWRQRPQKCSQDV